MWNLNVMLHGRFTTTIVSAAQRGNVGTMLEPFETMLWIMHLFTVTSGRVTMSVWNLTAVFYSAVKWRTLLKPSTPFFLFFPFCFFFLGGGWGQGVLNYFSSLYTNKGEDRLSSQVPSTDHHTAMINTAFQLDEEVSRNKRKLFPWHKLFCLFL